MANKLAELAAWLGGEVRGDAETLVEQALPLDDCQPGSITFLSDLRQIGKLQACSASAAVVPIDCPELALPTIPHADPLAAILEIASRLQPLVPRPEMGISPQASVHPSARIAPDASVGPFAVVEADVEIGPRAIIGPHAIVRRGCRIAADVELHPHVVLYPETIVGERSILHAGAVIGCDGFGYRVRDGRHVKVPQLGHVELGADVEIGSHSTVDRATLGATRIGEGTKIDNLVMIGHNCRIGRHNIFVSQVGMAGSCVTGDYVVLAGKAGIADHVTIGTGAVVGAYGGVFQDVPAGVKVLGLPARPERETKRIKLAEAKLPEMVRQLAEVRRKLGLDKDGTRDRSDHTASSDPSSPSSRREAG